MSHRNEEGRYGMLREILPSRTLGFQALKMISLRIVSVASFVLMLCLPCLGLSQGHEELKTSLKPEAIKAAYAACKEFSVFIGRRKSQDGLGKFASDINNYDVTIEPEKGGYAVYFVPLPYEGMAISGGDAIYHVNWVTYQVVGERHYK